MDQSATMTRVSDTGILTLPAELRRMVGLEHGGPVVVRVEDGEIRIRSVRDVLARLQAEARRVFAGSGETVAGFLRERRAELVRDNFLASCKFRGSSCEYRVCNASIRRGVLRPAFRG
jgi:AbrB family looped-hinge helix DNA binding protein